MTMPLHGRKSTRFEVSMFTHYKDTKGNENVEIGVVLGG